jgi:hypothetical protein
MERPDPVIRIVGLVLMIGAIALTSFSALMGLGLVLAWIGETGLTDELRPWVIATLLATAFFTAAGYGVFVVGRRLREHGTGSGED